MPNSALSPQGSVIISPESIDLIDETSFLMISKSSFDADEIFFEDSHLEWKLIQQKLLEAFLSQLI
ncbi:MAG: hypothetical protein CM15mP117_03420 [Alphaproteobacteria bacterium]|nr:MAG: hypothetical protein CM15mP117_03420 [Alphaproteobacteria bacterium]